jgi:hypothetical protein
MGTSLNHIYNRFQNYCYKSTIQFLATNMVVSHACLQNVNYFFCVRMVPSWRLNWKKMATFSNISVMSWQLVVLVEETGVPGENHRSVASQWKTVSHNVVSGTPRLGFELTTLVMKIYSQRIIHSYYLSVTCGTKKEEDGCLWRCLKLKYPIRTQ